MSEKIKDLKQYILEIQAEDYSIFDAEPYSCLSRIWDYILEIERDVDKIVGRGSVGEKEETS